MNAILILNCNTKKGDCFVEAKYFYNESTHRLHINGYCRESKIRPYNIRFFETEDEALAYDGRAVGVCKNCLKMRERILGERI